MLSERARRAVTVGSTGFWAVAVLFVFVGYAASSPLRAPYLHRMNLILFAPEGWSFFTRNPREPRLRVFEVDSRGVLHLRTLPQSSRERWFGLRRSGTAEATQLSALLQNIPAEQWTRTDALPQNARNLPLREHSAAPGAARLCGDFVIDRRAPVPWAWSKTRGRYQMPGESVRLRVNCTAEAWQ